MTRKYFRYVSPWTGQIKWYPYIERGIPQRPSPEWMREQEVNLDERMKKGASSNPLIRLVVGIALVVIVTLLILSVAGVIPGNFQDHRKPSENSQSNQEYPVEYYEKGGD